jgi:hypothetical protein
MIDRRLQIQTRIPESDKRNNLGVQHHNWGKGLSRDDVLSEQVELRKQARDVSSLLAKYETGKIK